MRKKFLIVLGLGMITLLGACSENVVDTIETVTETIVETQPTEITEEVDYTDELTQIAQIVISQIPDEVNADFSLPTSEGIEIIYTFGDRVHLEQYDYVSPFVDYTETVSIELKKGISSVTVDKEIFIIALDSGFNENKISLTIDIPIDWVNTEEYVDAEVVVSTKRNGVEITEHQTTEARLRSRGNSTQMFPKKPYRLKFNEKTSILGMPASKDYVLLAEYSDKSLMRNVITHKLSTLMDGIDYTLQTRYVDLYVNGSYHGVYVLTEQVENTKDKINITSEPGVYNTGFLIELDQRFYEQNIEDGWDWVVVRGIPYEIKSPDADDPLFTTAHHDYIFEYLIATENALINKSAYSHLIDLDNWIDFFVIQELVKNVDVGWSSVYMHKRQYEPLQFGPLWDFDLAMGNADYIDYGVENWYGMRDYKNRFFQLMMDVPEIRDAFKDRVLDLRLDYIPVILDAVLKLSVSLEDMAERNFERWPILNEYVWPNPSEVLEADTFLEQVDVIYRYLTNRSIWMSEAVFFPSYAEGDFDN